MQIRINISACGQHVNADINQNKIRAACAPSPARLRAGLAQRAQIGVLGLWNARFAAALRAASAPHRVHVTTKWRLHRP